MIKLNRWVCRYLLYTLPLVIGTIICYLHFGEDVNRFVGFANVLWEVSGWHFIIWFLFLVYTAFSLLFFQDFRERALSRLTFSGERDERESFISGRASKATFYSTLAVLILLFFLSGLDIQIYKKTGSEVLDGKSGVVSLGFGFRLFDTSHTDDEIKENQIVSIINMEGIPFTKESLFLFLILYHTGSYHFFNKRRLRAETGS